MDEERRRGNRDDRQGGRENLKGWVPAMIMLICFPPVGVVLLVLKFFGLGRRERNTWHCTGDEVHAAAAETRDEMRRTVAEAKAKTRRAVEEVKAETRQTVEEAKARARQETDGAKYRYRAPKQKRAAATAPPKGKKKPNIGAGRGLTVWGAICAGVFGLAAMGAGLEALRMSGLSWDFLEQVFVPLGFCGLGLVMVYYGLAKGKKAKRYRRYLALIGKRESIAVDTLAGAMGVSVRRAYCDLQDMLDAGLFPIGFLDTLSGQLVLSEDGLQDRPKPEPEGNPTGEAPKGLEPENAVLGDIRRCNDAIDDPVMSRKIDRIGEITGRIFGYLRENPGKEPELRSFLSYYLPTTLKILRAYAQMEAQGIEGDNITAAKARIEGMMDKVVDGFEKQLDKLFQDDAMDIATDVAVLERMLDKDGLGSQGLKMGG